MSSCNHNVPLTRLLLMLHIVVVVGSNIDLQLLFAQLGMHPLSASVFLPTPPPTLLSSSWLLSANMLTSPSLPLLCRGWRVSKSVRTEAV